MPDIRCSIDMDIDMQYGLGHAHNTALVMQHGSGQLTCMDAGMPIKSSVRHYGIKVSPIPLVTDESISAQH
jgi:hypothetical protein